MAIAGIHHIDYRTCCRNTRCTGNLAGHGLCRNHHRPTGLTTVPGTDLGVQPARM